MWTLLMSLLLMTCHVRGQNDHPSSLLSELETIEKPNLEQFDPLTAPAVTTVKRTRPPINLVAPRQSTNLIGNAGIVSDAEPEPGLSWSTSPTTTINPLPTLSATQPIVEETGSSTSGGRLLGYLQRITERLTSLESLEVQTLRRLEGLDYRLTRVEVQLQEKTESIRAATQDTARQLQTLESEIGRIETLLDVIRDDVTSTKTSQLELKIAVLNTLQSPAPAKESASEADVPAPRLQVLLAGMNSLRVVTNGLRDDMTILQKNLTTLANISKHIENRSLDFATKYDLHRGFTSLRTESNSPSRSVLPVLQTIPYSTFNNQQSSERIVLPRDCSEAQSMGAKQSGIQRIQPFLSSTPFFAYCDMDTRGGGWTVIHNRIDGVVNFLREWADYKNGFGNLANEFWIGLEKIHILTNQAVYELLVELTDFGLNTATAHYNAFAIGSEAEGYDLRLLGNFEGDAGDSLSYHSSMKFSTPDMDQDQWPDGNCARDHTGGWWYRGCDTSNLNGQYLNGNVPASYEYKGMYWYDYHGPLYSLMKARMMIRPLANAVGPFNTNSTSTTKLKVQPTQPTQPVHGRPTVGVKIIREERKDLKPKKKKESE